MNGKAMPIVGELLGAPSVKLEKKHVRKTPSEHNSAKLIESALVEISNILRRGLDVK